MITDKVLTEQIAIIIIAAMIDSPTDKIDLKQSEDRIALALILNILQNIKNVWSRNVCLC